MKYLKMILKNNTWHNTKRYCAQELSKKFENFRVPSRAKNLTWCWTVMSPYPPTSQGLCIYFQMVTRGRERRGEAGEREGRRYEACKERDA
jgi:hypothetical protein